MGGLTCVSPFQRASRTCRHLFLQSFLIQRRAVVLTRAGFVTKTRRVHNLLKFRAPPKVYSTRIGSIRFQRAVDALYSCVVTVRWGAAVAHCHVTLWCTL